MDEQKLTAICMDQEQIIETLIRQNKRLINTLVQFVDVDGEERRLECLAAPIHTND